MGLKPIEAKPVPSSSSFWWKFELLPKTCLMLSMTLSISSGAICAPIPNLAAQGKTGEIIRLEVGTGFGTSLNFVETGEVIDTVWLDDPSQLAYSGDGNLCQLGRQCRGKSASRILHLKRIAPINFPGIVSNPDGSTLLTVITKKNGRSKQYVFELVPIMGKPVQYKYEIEGEEPIEPRKPNIPFKEVRRPQITEFKFPGEVPERVTKLQFQVPNSSVSAAANPPSENLSAIEIPSQEVLRPPNLPQVTEFKFPGEIPERVTEIQFQVPNSTVSAAANPPSGNLSAIDSIKQANYITTVLRSLSLPSSQSQESARQQRILEIRDRVRERFPALKPRSQIWRNVNTVVFNLRRGKTIAFAASSSRMSVQSVEDLIRWGQELESVSRN